VSLVLRGLRGGFLEKSLGSTMTEADFDGLGGAKSCGTCGTCGT
jgi:hypothetical protein